MEKTYTHLSFINDNINFFSINNEEILETQFAKYYLDFQNKNWRLNINGAFVNAPLNNETIDQQFKCPICHTLIVFRIELKSDCTLNSKLESQFFIFINNNLGYWVETFTMKDERICKIKSMNDGKCFFEKIDVIFDLSNQQKISNRIKTLFTFL